MNYRVGVLGGMGPSSSQAPYAPGQSLLPLRGNSPSRSFPPERQELIHSAAPPLPTATADAGSRRGPLGLRPLS